MVMKVWQLHILLILFAAFVGTAIGLIVGRGVGPGIGTGLLAWMAGICWAAKKFHRTGG